MCFIRLAFFVFSPVMKKSIPDVLAIIAGSGVYPRLLATSARKSGVRRIFVLAFKGETDKAMADLCDEVQWVSVGQLSASVAALKKSGAAHAVMVGRITPTALFHVRPDAEFIQLLASLRERNAHTIFGALASRLADAGIELMPAHTFMDDHLAPAGLIGTRGPTESENADLALGMKVAKVTSGLDIGQTVVIKEGTIVAIEAFEGTDETIKRAGGLCGKGAVVVKAAKAGHDMRFDIPVIGVETIALLKRIGAVALGVEAGRTLLLEREKVAAAADKAGICLTGLDARTET